MEKPEKTDSPNKTGTAKKNIPCPECREPITPTRPLVVTLRKHLFSTGVDVHYCKRCRHMVISAENLDRAMLSFVKQQIEARARVPKELRKEFVVRLPASMKESLAARAKNESKSIDTRTAGGRMVVNMLGVVAQWEREVIGERTSVAMLHKAAQGEHTGGVIPFGYQLGPDGKKLVPHNDEQQVILLARRYRGRGLTLRAIADKLNHQGHCPRRAQRFGPVQVQRILGRAA